MKAILLKDLFTIRKQLYWILSIVLFFTIFNFFVGNGMMLLTLGFIFGTVQVSTLFTFDEMSRWDQFANTLPLKKEKIILSKYVMNILVTIGIMIIIIPVVVFQNMMVEEKIPSDSLLAIFCFVTAASLLLSGLSFPFYVKFSSQKGKFALLAFAFIPAFLIGFFVSGMENPLDMLPSIETMHAISYIMPIISIVFLIISYFVSVKFYKNKEF